jgi:hypothetical protein
MDVDYGPLTNLIGNWAGDMGVDIAPEPDGSAESPFYETLEFTACRTAENAESQELAVVRYQQIVSRKSNGEVFHDQTGYWMWHPATEIVMQSLAIPRAVCVLAGGTASETDGQTTLAVHAAIDDPDWGVIQSPFMRDNARTISFNHRLIVGSDILGYSETTVLDIYGEKFDHSDANELHRTNRTGDRE